MRGTCQEKNQRRTGTNDKGKTRRSTTGDTLAAAANEDQKKDNKKAIEEQDQKGCDKRRKWRTPRLARPDTLASFFFLGESPARRGQQEEKERTSVSGVAFWSCPASAVLWPSANEKH